MGCVIILNMGKLFKDDVLVIKKKGRDADILEIRDVLRNLDELMLGDVDEEYKIVLKDKSKLGRFTLDDILLKFG